MSKAKANEGVVLLLAEAPGGVGSAVLSLRSPFENGNAGGRRVELALEADEGNAASLCCPPHCLTSLHKASLVGGPRKSPRALDALMSQAPALKSHIDECDPVVVERDMQQALNRLSKWR